MTDDYFNELIHLYKVGRKHEKKQFSQYLYYYIDENININNRDMEELKKNNAQEAIKSSIERFEAKNEILKNIKEYISLYVDVKNSEVK